MDSRFAAMSNIDIQNSKIVWWLFADIGVCSKRQAMGSVILSQMNLLFAVEPFHLHKKLDQTFLTGLNVRLIMAQ